MMTCERMERQMRTIFLFDIDILASIKFIYLFIYLITLQQIDQIDVFTSI